MEKSLRTERKRDKLKLTGLVTTKNVQELRNLRLEFIKAQLERLCILSMKRLPTEEKAP